MGEMLRCPCCMRLAIQWQKDGPPPAKFNGVAPCACVNCHNARTVEMASRVGPSTDHFDPVGASRYEPPPERFRRPHSDGHRVIRKSEPMAG